MFFKIIKKSKKSNARLGLIKTAHGSIHTPAFYPVATKAAIKGLSLDEVKKIGFEAVLSNTYHLYLQPGHKVVQKLGGLHKFMNWDGPIITDSGGFQVFSLGLGLEHGIGKIIGMFPGNKRKPSKLFNVRLMKVNQEGVDFRSHLDGSKHKLSPQKSIEIQESLGADIILAFDECTSPLADKKYTREAMLRTHRWAEICLKVKKRKDQFLFGIIQGGRWHDLRIESARFINSLPFAGLAIGGPLGNTKKDMRQILDWVIPEMDPQKPRHLLGIGYVDDIIQSVKKGIDLFDCVEPTRLARHGILLTKKGKINILNSRYKEDKKPINNNCHCYTCQNFSRAYLHHLFKAKEMLGPTLATYHNLWFMNQLMEKIREDIKNNKI